MQYLNTSSFMRIATSPRIFSPTLIYSHALQVSSPYITLSLENMVFGCSSRVRDLHVRLAKAVRHISFRSEDHRHKQEQKSKSIFFRIKMETVQRLHTHTHNTHSLAFSRSRYFRCDDTRCSGTHNWS